MTNGKAFGFGRMIPEHFKGSWEELIRTPDWKKLVESRKFTQETVWYIQQGFEQANKPQGDPLDDQIFPFGDFKGKKFSQLPEKYLIWLSRKDWLEKWPTVATYVNRYMDKLKEGQASPEEIKSILQPIK